MEHEKVHETGAGVHKSLDLSRYGAVLSEINVGRSVFRSGIEYRPLEEGRGGEAIGRLKREATEWGVMTHATACAGAPGIANQEPGQTTVPALRSGSW